eukprot:2330781-Prymnesium_polylepis.1
MCAVVCGVRGVCGTLRRLRPRTLLAARSCAPLKMTSGTEQSSMMKAHLRGIKGVMKGVMKGKDGGCDGGCDEGRGEGCDEGCDEGRGEG